MSSFYNSKNKVQAVVSGLTAEIMADLKSKNLVPRGSSLMTSSGKLSPLITAIFHAATGTKGSYSPNKPYYEPTLQSVEDSISACFDLGKLNGNKRLAVPYIGGSIFKRRIFRGQGLTQIQEDDQLIGSVVGSTLQSAESTGLDFCFVAFDKKANSLFQSELRKSPTNVDLSAHLKLGNIVDFDLHACDGIVNAANMEVVFGGGISGAIASATQHASAIDQEARSYLVGFWSEYELGK